MTSTHTGETDRRTVEEVRAAAQTGDAEAIVEMGRLFRAGVASQEDLADAEARALALYRPADPDSLGILFALRREVCTLPLPPPCLDAVNAELDRRQAIGREPDPPELDEAGLAALRENAATGDAEAGYLLGRVLLRGEHSDKPKALAALLRAAEAGHVAAGFQAGTLLYHGWGVPQDVSRALALLESSARAGSADAARFLALAYDGFTGRIPKDPETAMRWWNEAARLGDPHACWFVGRLTIEECTTAEERDRGWELMEYAGGRGFPLACGFAGVVEAGEHRFHPERLDGPALPLLRLGAVRGDYEAARCLAESLRTLGGEERYAEAVYWLRKASLRDAASSRVLAHHYFTGHGVPRSDETGAAWLALASEEGDAEATYLLAAAFHEGLGVPVDQEAAVCLAERAAAAGCCDGARLLGAMYDDGAGVPRDGARAVAWFERGAELGDRDSEYCLANVLFDGRGVDPDPARAFPLLERASGIVRDHVDHLLALMLFRGEGVSPDPARARTEFLRAVDGSHLPSLFTTLDEEALRYRPAAIRRRDLRDSIAEMVADPEALTAASALDLGLLYWNADAGLSEDRSRAAELLSVAAIKGSALAAACLSHALQLDGDEAGEMEWLEKAAASGLPGAQRRLAFRLVETDRATWEDPRVVRLLESAADSGDVRACVKLVYLLGGPDEPPDPRAAERVRTLKRCAEEGGYRGEDILEY